MLKNFEMAINDLTLLIKIHNNMSFLFNYYYHRGSCYFKLKKYELALMDFSEAVSRKPNNPVLFNSLGKCYCELKDYEMAIKNFSFSITQDPEYKDAHQNRAKAYREMGLYQLAGKDFKKSIKDDPKNENIKCELAQLFFLAKDMRKSVKYYKKAIDDAPQNPNICRQRLETLKQFDIVRSIQDLEYLYHCDLDKDTKSQLDDCFRKLEQTQSQKEESQWFPFLKDNMSDMEKEKEHIAFQKKRLKELLEKDPYKVKFYRRLGKGSFCFTYLCRIDGFEGIFVAKISKNSFEIGKKMEEKEKDCIPLSLGYHRNIVNILSDYDDIYELQIKKLPDYEECWKKNSLIKNGILKTPFLLMKYYRKTLNCYVQQRVKIKKINVEKKRRKRENLKKKREEKEEIYDHVYESKKVAPYGAFTILEIVFILKGLIEGVKFLQDHGIVHRDLHGDNVFVDEVSGRVYIGDFGCSLNLKNHPNGLMVKSDEDVVQNFGYSYKILELGGSHMFLPPEVLDIVEGGIIDYSKSDYFSIGMLGYYIVVSFNDQEFAPFGFEDEKLEKLKKKKKKESKQKSLEEEEKKERKKPRTKHREQEKYKDLETDVDISHLIKNLLLVDVNKRYGYEESIEQIRKIEKRCMSIREIIKETDDKELNICRRRLNELTDIIDDKRDNIDARIERFKILDQLPKFRYHALEELKGIIKLSPTSENYELRSDFYFKDKKYSLSIEDLTEAIKKSEKNATLRYKRGLINLKLKESERALEDFSLAIMLDPNCHQAYFERGQIHEKREETHTNAFRDFTDALRIRPYQEEYKVKEFCLRSLLAYYNKDYFHLVKERRIPPTLEEIGKRMFRNSEIIEKLESLGFSRRSSIRALFLNKKGKGEILKDFFHILMKNGGCQSELTLIEWNDFFIRFSKDLREEDFQIEDCVKNGICTYSVTKNLLGHQRNYFCLDCGFNVENGLVICHSCKEKCHYGHRIVTSGRGLSFCDCGSGMNFHRLKISCKCIIRSTTRSDSLDSKIRIFNEQEKMEIGLSGKAVIEETEGEEGDDDDDEKVTFQKLPKVTPLENLTLLSFISGIFDTEPPEDFWKSFRGEIIETEGEKYEEQISHLYFEYLEEKLKRNPNDVDTIKRIIPIYEKKKDIVASRKMIKRLKKNRFKQVPPVRNFLRASFKSGEYTVKCIQFFELTKLYSRWLIVRSLIIFCLFFNHLKLKIL